MTVLEAAEVARLVRTSIQRELPHIREVLVSVVPYYPGLLPVEHLHDTSAVDKYLRDKLTRKQEALARLRAVERRLTAEVEELDPVIANALVTCVDSDEDGRLEAVVLLRINERNHSLEELDEVLHATHTHTKHTHTH